MKENRFTKYIYVYITQLIRSFIYKFDVYGNIIMQTIIMITSAFFWKALFKDSVLANGITSNDMLTYTIISSVLSILFTTTVERRIQMGVINGSVVMDLMHPVNIFGVYFAENLGTVTALIIQNVIPVLLIGSLLLGVPAISDPSMIPLFVLSVAGSFFINWFIAAIFGTWAFTAIEMDALIQVKKHLIRLLSGSIIPLWFFPKGLRFVLELLPFAYIYQLPLNIYVGSISTDEICRMMLIQLFWLIALFIILIILQSRVLKKLMVQGG